MNVFRKTRRRSSIDGATILLGALLGIAAAPGDAAEPAGTGAAVPLTLGEARPFSFEALQTRARDLARGTYVEVACPAPATVEKIDYDAHGKIKFRPSSALWADGPSRFPVTFFHVGRYFQKPVRMHVVENGQAREIRYRPEYFEMPEDSVARALPPDTGFAGFRFQEARDGKLDWRRNDWVAFLGASYFRAIGALYQYGLSARGIAIDVANPNPGRGEEFPQYTEIYLEHAPEMPDGAVIHALLDGPSVSGALRFVTRRGEGVVMDVDASLHLRKDVARLGIAPLTSMYWFSEKAKSTMIDWRPEVHDSDGLSLWTGAGERIWRPLNNPPRLVVSAFGDERPRGFGLSQRDRAFDHYLDGVRYERRPTLWVEPLGDWGKGAIQLVEIPTDDEIHDNIVAMWVPSDPARAGQSREYRYRLHWLADEPHPGDLGRCVATRLGRGGQPGTQRPAGVRKFLVEFLGGPLATVPYGAKVVPVLSASRGAFSYVFAEAVPDDVPGHWRAQFDLTVTGDEPVEMRCYLRCQDKVMTETWAYQYHPGAGG